MADRLTPEALRAHATAPDSIGWQGQARQLLKWAADVIEAADALIEERRGHDSSDPPKVMK